MTNERYKIGKREAIALLVTVMTYKVYLSYFEVIASLGGAGGWMIVLISGLVALGMYEIIYKLIDRFPSKTFPELVEEIVGPIIAVPILLAFLSGWLFDIGTTLRRTGEIMVSISLPNVPLWQIVLMLILGGSIGAYFGGKIIAGVAYLSFPFLFGTLFIVFFAVAYRWDMNFLFPMFGPGVKEILIRGVGQSGDFSEANFLYALPLLFYHKQIRQIGRTSIVIAFFVLFVGTVSMILTYSATLVQAPYAPLFLMARVIYYSRFLQRVEMLFVLFWVVSASIWFSAGLYGICFMLARWLKLPDYRPFLLPVTIFMLAIGFIPTGLPEATLMYVKYREIAFISAFGLPALLWLIAVVRHKGVEANAREK